MSDQMTDQEQYDFLDSPEFQARLEKSKQETRAREDARNALAERDRPKSPHKRKKVKCSERRRTIKLGKKNDRRTRLSANRSERKGRKPKKCARVTFYGNHRVPGPKPVRYVPAASLLDDLVDEAA